MRHQEGKAAADVAKCYYCAKEEDSVTHLFERCQIVKEARKKLLLTDNTLTCALLISCPVPLTFDGFVFQLCHLAV